MNKFMKIAIREAEIGITNGDGGPFGAVVVKDGKVIGKGHNKVVSKNDPTCHGEIDAIRNACENIKSFDLKGCEIYTTSEPCPMCFGAILWSNIEHIYFGCSIKENHLIGFRDKVFYENFSTKGMEDKSTQIDYEECMKLFNQYMKMKNKTNY